MPDLSPSAAGTAAQLEDVRRNVAASASRAGRSPSSVQLIAVSKTFGADRVREAYAAGQRDFGENRVQEGLEKMEAVADLSIAWHLIGHLQSNKARKAAAAFQWIHSVDSRELLTKLDAGATAAGSRPRILIQVDLAHEATKSGADERDVPDLVKAALDATSIELNGLMIVPPIPEHAEDSRPWFRRLRELRDSLVAAGTPAARLAHLSMGMSHDFDVAIAEGATMVRIGTAIFGTRPPITTA